MGRLRCYVLFAVFAAASLLTAAACGIYNDHPFEVTATPADANLVQDAGFEGNVTPWAAAATPQTSSVGHDGRRSAVVSASGNAAVAFTQILPSMPPFISGFYRVDSWKPPLGKGYIAFAISTEVPDTPVSLRTLHFVIGGLQLEPADASPTNKYLFISRSMPAVSAWTYFGYPVGDAFRSAFGEAARGTIVRVALEVAGSGASAGFDDIYAGPQLNNPNRPPQQ